MKPTTKTSRTAAYIEKMVRALNEHYFGGELEEPIVTIQNTPKVYGQVTENKTWHRADGTQHRALNIGAGTLDLPIEEVTAIILGQLVRLYDIQRGIKDSSREGRYMNKRFRDEAATRDLEVSKDPRSGWSIIEPTEALIEFVISQGWTDIQMGRDGGSGSQRTEDDNDSNAGTADGSGKKRSSTRKIVCPVCGQSVRAARDAYIKCGYCDLLMV